MESNKSQWLLIFSGLLVTGLLSLFFYRELFPEYKLYQTDFIALEAFHATLTHESPAPFKTGIKQIVLEREDKGPPVVDRCISCHVALEIPYYSPTKIVTGPDNKPMLNEKGEPQLVPNEAYIWKNLRDKIAALTDEKELAALRLRGEKSQIDSRLAQAAVYQNLQTVEVGGHLYDMTKVLTMHPLMGKETRPFEYHPIEEYGCTSCHNGNGRGLTTEHAHGPIFDGQYEAENEGPIPHFTESDPSNDPPFAHIFNAKPGHELLFQTEPLFLGRLMEAKCVQCHRVDSYSEQKSANLEIDALTKGYQHGEELYLSQACYACHKITGFARGGVGPELTRAGEGYPWYLKQSIVWPQADLKTSSMPNFRLDHPELEDLMTFLLAQKGANKGIARTHYQAFVRAWESGKKRPWEEPVRPEEIDDLSRSMTLFATEGCASCHRLQGFETQVGFRAEMDPNHSPEDNIKLTQWFKNLFPETIHIAAYDEELPGSEIVSQIEKNHLEIDEKISSELHPKGQLETIEAEYPGIIDSFYSNFRYASRAKDHFYRKLAQQETDPEKQKLILEELAKWKERVHRVKMLYIRTYGLGRLIGPHLNWSGIYRSDEWLMQHFRNPTALVPRSIMPIFPFDDSKFYALIHMLDRLGIRNRDQVRKLWSNRGFSPEEAFDIHCAQCHGIGRQGNGVVAEWIYPPPKNLKNPDFLRNLTKEQALHSIQNGIAGTPMPPWGEQKKTGSPVLSETEIRYLVDWLFSVLPGEEVIKTAADVPKWGYQPQDLIRELKRENPKLILPFEQAEESSIFTRKPNRRNPQEPLYYIKDAYYTPENIEAGKDFFLLNCAACHGNEADGSGLRGEAMQEAKPRMLTNLQWISSRDDLYLLRGIKYGVAGTAMIPWGDQTSALQRLQLVLFIRSLNRNQESQNSLNEALYLGFDPVLLHLDEAHAKTSSELNQLEQSRASLEKERGQPDISLEKKLELTTQLFEIDAKLKKVQEHNRCFLRLKTFLKQERQLYQQLGAELLSISTSKNLLEEYGTFVKSRHSLDDFSMKNNRSNGPSETAFLKQIEIEKRVLTDEQVRLKKMGPAANRTKQTEELQEAIQKLERLEEKFLAALAEIEREKMDIHDCLR